MRNLILTLLFFVSLAVSGKSQTQEKGSYRFDLIISNITLFDGNRVVEHANIYVKDGFIKEIKTNKNVEKRLSKVVIDGSGKTLMPGLINAHCHPDLPEHLKEAAQAGVLTLLDIFAMKEELIPNLKSLSNSPQYAYYYTSGNAADMPGGVISVVKPELSVPHPTDTDAAKEFIKNRIINGADLIKIFQESGARLVKEQFSDSLFEFLIAETHRHNKVVTVHIGTLKDARLAFDKGADVLAHLWRGQDGIATEADLKNWQKRPFYITPTLLTFKLIGKPKAPRLYTLSFETYVNEVGRLKKANITVLAGTDASGFVPDINMGADLYRELEMFVQAGMTPLEALQTATINPAKAFKLKDKGVIKKGMTADFVMVNGNVLNNIQELNKVESVWKHGVKIR